MIIRKATIKDLELLVQLRFDYIAMNMGILTAEEEMRIHKQLNEYFTKHIEVDFIAYFAEVDEQVVSVAYLAIFEKPANPHMITGRTGTLLNVFTRKEYRRKGLSSQVISRLIEEAKAMDISYIELSATEDGQPLYKKLGFAVEQSKYTGMRLRL